MCAFSPRRKLDVFSSSAKCQHLNSPVEISVNSIKIPQPFLLIFFAEELVPSGAKRQIDLLFCNKPHLSAIIRYIPGLALFSALKYTTSQAGKSVPVMPLRTRVGESPLPALQMWECGPFSVNSKIISNVLPTMA